MIWRRLCAIWPLFHDSGKSLIILIQQKSQPGIKLSDVFRATQMWLILLFFNRRCILCNFLNTLNCLHLLLVDPLKIFLPIEESSLFCPLYDFRIQIRWKRKEACLLYIEYFQRPFMDFSVYILVLVHTECASHVSIDSRYDSDSRDVALKAGKRAREPSWNSK